MAGHLRVTSKGQEGPQPSSGMVPVPRETISWRSGAVCLPCLLGGHKTKHRVAFAVAEIHIRWKKELSYPKGWEQMAREAWHPSFPSFMARH